MKKLLVMITSAAMPRRGSLLYKTPTKRTAHRLAAVLSLAFAASAWANSNWTGETDNDFGTASNWSRGVPPNDVMVVQSGNFSNRFKNQENPEIVFTDYYENARWAAIRSVGTADKPLVFRATDAEYGLQFGNSDNNALNVANNSGNAYVRFENGKWSTGAKIMLVGSSSYAGYLTLKDINSFTVGAYLDLANGALTLDGGAISIGGGDYSRLGSAGKTAEFTIESGSVTQGSLYLGIGEGNGSTATMTVKSGGSFTNTNNTNGIIVGTDSPGTLNIQGGTVTLMQLTFEAIAKPRRCEVL